MVSKVMLRFTFLLLFFVSFSIFADEEKRNAKKPSETGKEIFVKGLKLDNFLWQPVERGVPKAPNIYGKKNISGCVFLSFTIGGNGMPKNIEVLRAFPDNLAVESSMEAVSKWVYEPTQLNPNRSEELGRTTKINIHGNPRKIRNIKKYKNSCYGIKMVNSDQ